MTATIRLRELELAAAKGSTAVHITCCRRAENRLEHAFDLYKDAIQTIQGLGVMGFNTETIQARTIQLYLLVQAPPQTPCVEPFHFTELITNRRYETGHQQTPRNRPLTNTFPAD